MASEKHAIILVTLALMLAACSHSVAVGNPQAMEELERLGALNQQGQLTEADLGRLEELVGDDHEAEHHLEELQLMVKYQERAHADHAIGFLSAYLQTGEEVLCPGHDLAHYYVLMEHGETEAAGHALESAEETMDAWEAAAREYEKEYPGPETVDAVKARLEDHLARIATDDSTATDEEVTALATESLCVAQ